MTYTNGINNLSQSLPTQTTVALQKPAIDSRPAENAAVQTTSAPADDQASLSPTSTLIAQALSGSDVRADKVASLQQAIGAGTYSVSSADVADKLLQTLQG